LGPLGNVPTSNISTKEVKKGSERAAHGIASAQTRIECI